MCPDEENQLLVSAEPPPPRQFGGQTRRRSRSSQELDSNSQHWVSEGGQYSTLSPSSSLSDYQWKNFIINKAILLWTIFATAFYIYTLQVLLIFAENLIHASQETNWNFICTLLGIPLAIVLVFVWGMWTAVLQKDWILLIAPSVVPAGAMVYFLLSSQGMLGDFALEA